MDLEAKWEKAIRKTEIVRVRLPMLLTFKATELPYLFLAESSVNIGDTVLREGKVVVERPLIILPRHYPQFEGFDFTEDLRADNDTVGSFLFMRGIRFPSLKYSNETSKIEVLDGSLKKAIDRLLKELEREKDILSGLVVGPEDCWQFSILFYVASLAMKSASGDIKNLLDELLRRESYH